MERLGDDVVATLALDAPEVLPVAGGTMADVWRGQRHGEVIALRASQLGRRLEEVRYECDVISRLAAAGAPVAAPLTSPALVEGRVWVAFAWVDGAHEAAPVADPARYGQLLAEVHAFTDQLVGEVQQRPGWGRLDEFMTLTRTADGVTFDTVMDDFALAHGRVGRELVESAGAVDDRLRVVVHEQPFTVAHGDFGPHQVLWGEANVAAVVDWDFVHVDLAAADLAIATAWARPTAARACAFLHQYATASRAVGTDPRLLADLRRAFHLTNLAGVVCRRWTAGDDISAHVARISTRLERELWWEPMLIAGARAAPRPRTDLRVQVPEDLTDLEVAHELIDRAETVALHYFGAGVHVQAKEDSTPVTDADRAIEALLRESLSYFRPSDAVLGEETGRTGDGSRVWLIDPIDGTRRFADGDSVWRIQLALQEGDEIVVAVVDAPALHYRMWAAVGRGAFERTVTAGGGTERRLQVSSTTTLQDAAVDVHPRTLVDPLPTGVHLFRGDDLALVSLVRGEIDAYFVDCCFAWDHAPWILLVTEAGGAFTDHEGGRRADRSGGLYSNGHLHHELNAAVRRRTT